MASMKTFYITTSIPYVNADPHIGHALEFAQADILARFERSRGKDVFFLIGTDENALKNVQAAESAGVAVERWVNDRAEVFRQLASSLSISNDDFIRTASEERHRKGAQKLWASCKNGDIYKKKYKGLYCVGCESFKTEKDLTKGECPEHPGKKLEAIEEENYFFKLSNYQNQLRDLIESNRLKIIPESRRNEILKFIKSGLEDFSISRSRERARNWGIPVPGDENQIMYVWFDALSNYINALGYADNGEKFVKYWEKGDEIVHAIGKDINRFHTVYWPAMLISAGVRLPDSIFVHGFITSEGQKMSKTLGNVVNPAPLIQKYGVDAVRHYLLREIPSYEDGDFSIKKFEERYNSDLANGLGNFAARVLTLGEKISPISLEEEKNIDSEILRQIGGAKINFEGALRERRFESAAQAVWSLISWGDGYVNEKKPWETNDRKVIAGLVVLLRTIGYYLVVLLPSTAEKLLGRIVQEGDAIKIIKGEALFPRLN